MIIVRYDEMENGAVEVRENGANTMELLETMTEEEFHAAYPGVYADDVAEYLENGAVLCHFEWNGEQYTLKNGDRYRPAYRTLDDEDNFEIVGYYLV